MSAIRGKIASVLNIHQAAINVGSKSGVAVGDIARVVRLTDIFDPDTKASLGKVETPVVKLRVSSVSEAFCLAETFEPAGGFNDLLAMFAGRGSAQADPVEQISQTPDPLGKAITVPIGSTAVIEKPSPAKPPASHSEAKGTPS